MYGKDHLRSVLASVLFLFMMSGCRAAEARPSATLTLQASQTPSSTPTESPTFTATPDLTATQQAQDFHQVIGEFNDGIDPSNLSGTYHVFEDYSDSLAGNLDVHVKTYGILVDAFILKTHISLSNASGVSSTAGCGMALNLGSGVLLQQNGEVYVYYLTSLLNPQGNGQAATYENLLKDQTDHFGHRNNPADIDVVLLVLHDTLTLFVDGKQALHREALSTSPIGDLNPGFALRSGSDYDYGTRCSFTGTDFWEISGN